MKAIVVKEFGGPDVLRLEDVPDPAGCAAHGEQTRRRPGGQLECAAQRDQRRVHGRRLAPGRARCRSGSSIHRNRTPTSYWVAPSLAISRIQTTSAVAWNVES